ncbi:MAG: DUF4160 domain-containing protein [Ignavibacteriae bacterium]|nr:DUF4160 domain-containing protein [Ignavibacteriota bacterium]
MPKLYEYLGISIFFYSNEHKPIHVHGRFQGRESKVEIVIEDGEIVEVKLLDVSGKRPLSSDKSNEFVKFVNAYADDIVRKWIDFFVYGKQLQPKVIRRRIR